jgi:MarR family transcriptional regulator, lower aerobic nicotinate degradation pathway regulator
VLHEDFRDLPTWLLARAALRSHRILRDHLAAHGVTGYQFRVLSVLRSCSASQAQVGRRAHLDRRDVTVTVRELAEAGLVRRNRSADDARAQLVSITDNGLQRLAELDLAATRVQDDTFAALSPHQRSQLLDLLQRIADPAT